MQQTENVAGEAKEKLIHLQLLCDYTKIAKLHTCLWRSFFDLGPKRHREDDRREE